MPKFRTHYDNLKVSRDAPIEVIQAAYRSLARKYHPDKTGSTQPDGESKMKIINASYEVLSDPVRRAEHDRWISAQESNGPRNFQEEQPRPRSAPPTRASDDLQATITSIVFTLVYFAVAFWMIRIPSLRVIGFVLLIGGWFFFKTRRR